MKGQQFSAEQLRKMISLLDQMVIVTERFLVRADLTLEERELTEKVKAAAETYSDLLRSVPDEKSTLWIPILKAIIPELFKLILGKLPEILKELGDLGDAFKHVL